MRSFQPLASKSRSEQAAERIMQMIEAGELRVGDKLPNEQEFAKQLGISRGILREGLAQLKAQGIITRKPKDGTYIQPFQKGQSDMTEKALQAIRASSFRNIMEMRDAIEQKAAALVVERATDEELNELRETVLSGVGPATDEELDFYFHYRMVELSGNPIFMSIVDTYFKEIREIRTRNLDDGGVSYHNVLEEHMEVVDALCRRDRVGAMAAIERHMKNICDRWDAQNQETLGGGQPC